MLKRFVCLFLLLFLCIGVSFCEGVDYRDKVQISLVTFGKDKEIYSKFGHTGILIEEPNKPSWIYDWGRFSFGKGFAVNFAFGKLWYMCGRSYGDWTLNIYARENRDVNVIKLNLTATQKEDIVNIVEENIKEENKIYLYNFFYNNCATRVRDIIDIETGGAFREWAESKPSLTLREHTNNIVSSSFPWWYLINYLLGPECDTERTFWDAMFLPKYVSEAVREYDNSSLVAEDADFYTSTRKEDSLHNTRNIILCFVISILFSLCAYYGYTHSRFMWLYKTSSIAYNFIQGFFGCILIFLMLFSLYKVTLFNENIYFINPILVALGILTFRTTDKKNLKHRKLLFMIYAILCEVILLLIVLKIILKSVFIQDNLAFILSALPFYATQVWLLKRAK